MLPRHSAVIISLTSLFVGILLGVVLGRGGPAVSAQVAPTAHAEVGADAGAADRSRPAYQQKQADDAIYDVLSKQYEQFEHVNRTFELVARAVSPALVHIVAQKTGRQDEHRRLRHFEETGSGVIVRSDRVAGLYVLTNHHVVDGSKPAKIKVCLRDGRTLAPARIWTDSKADIAVLKLDRDDLPAARMGNSDEAAVGTWVMALGSPFGLMHSVSQGIISARGRHVDELADVENQDFLQTDAAINPGNSGGPLVNMKGEVVGINNSIASNGGGNEGVGFSIPINLARWIMNELVVNGRVTRGALGVDLHPAFGAEDAIALGMERPRGAWIDAVHPSSPAAKAGVRDGDVVLRFAGVDISDLNHLINLVSMSRVGQPAEIVIWRGGRVYRLEVTVGDRERTLSGLTTAPREPAGDSAELIRRPNRPTATSNFALGMELATLTAEVAQGIELPESWRGAVVLRIDAQSPLARSVQPNDVISAVGDQVIQSAEQAVKILNERTDHAQSVISVDRFTRGTIERHTIRVP
jgi:serine protease Do